MPEARPRPARDVSVLASLRAADPLRLAAAIEQLERAGIDGLHIDVMDGHLVPELCLGPATVAAVRQATTLMLDVHLLAELGASWQRTLEVYLQAGADRITVHVEACGAPAELTGALDTIRRHGRAAGLACFPSTPLAALEPWLEGLALVNPLGVDPRAGTGFDATTIDRLAWLVRWRAEHGARWVLQADGGVWEQTRDRLVEAGADELVGGYPIFSATDTAAAVRSLRAGYG